MAKRSTSNTKWQYRGKFIKEPPEGVWGFVYRVSWDEGYYIGQKAFYNVRNVRISKKRAEELYSGRGAKKKKERKQTESNWRTYNTSSKEVESLILSRGEQNFTFTILEYAKSKNELNYLETKHIICGDCLRDERCFNGWVNVKISKLK